MVTFQDLVYSLENLGVVDVLLPFLLIFTIVFAILQKIKIFGDKRRNVHIILSLVIGLSVVIPHVMGTYPPGMDVVDIMNKSLPQVSIILVAILAGFLMLGLFGITISDNFAVVGGIFSIAAVVYIFGSAAGWWSGWSWLTSVFGEETITLVIIILVFAALVMYITKDEDADTPGEGFVDSIKGLFEKH